MFPLIRVESPSRTCGIGLGARGLLRVLPGSHHESSSCPRDEGLKSVGFRGSFPRIPIGSCGKALSCPRDQAGTPWLKG